MTEADKCFCYIEFRILYIKLPAYNSDRYLIYKISGTDSLAL